MSASSIYCAACGLQNPREAAFCNGCGSRLTLPASPEHPANAEHPAKTLGRDILKETGKEVRDELLVRPISRVISGLILTVLTTIAATLNAYLLTRLYAAKDAAGSTASTAVRSFPGWFLLTWPLTLASAVIVLLARRSLKGSIAIVPVGAVVVIAAAWLGTTISGVAYYTSPSGWSEEPAGSFIGVALGMLGRMLEIYGTEAFVMAIITGAIVGLIVDRVTPEGITQVS